MKNNSFEKVLKDYLEKIYNLYRQENPPGIDVYCSLLRELIYLCMDYFEGNIAREKVSIEILQMPGGIPVHTPRIRLWDGRAKIYGYIDTLAPNVIGIDLRSYSNFDLYNKVYSNFLLTNFFIFLYYKDQFLVSKPRPFAASFSGQLTKKFKVNNYRAFIELMESFLNYKDRYLHLQRISHSRKVQDLSLVNLQKQLAMKSFYLKEYILPPLMKYLESRNEESILFQVYREYYEFFNRQMSIYEFSSFITHAIVDSLLKSLINFPGEENSGESYFSCVNVSSYGNIEELSQRKKLLYQCISSEKIPMSLRWILDDMLSLISQFNMVQLRKMSENPQILKVRNMQWSGYFFSPYYNSQEEQVRIIELLEEDGIF